MIQFRTVLLIFVVIFGVVIVACCIAAICIDIRQNSGSLLPVPNSTASTLPPLILHTFKAGEHLSRIQCCICLEDFADRGVTMGQCGHQFHTQCVVSWLAKDKGQTCPLCRKEFVADVP